MKNLWKTLLTMAVIGAALMAAGYVLGAEMSVYIDFGGLHIGNEERGMQSQPDIGKVTDIEIDVLSADIEIVPSDKFGFDISSRDNAPITYTLEGGRLKISQALMRSLRLVNLDFDFTNDTVTVYVPESEALNNVSIKTLSGTINIGELNCRRLEMSMASGNTKIYRAMAKELNVHSVSGDVALNQCEAENFGFVLASGKLTADGLQSNGLSVNLTSGDANISGRFNGSNSIKVLSGDVNMKIYGEEDDYNRTVSLVSGDVHINGTKSNASVRNSADNDLIIDITSGDVKIEFVK